MLLVCCGKHQPDIPEPTPEPPKPVAVTSVTVTPTSQELTVGQSFNLTATVLPENASDKSISWSSSDSKVATVSSSGSVNALEAGKATIAVTTNDGKKTATCEVIVKAAHVPVTSVAIEPSSLTIEEGKTVALTSIVLPSNASDPAVKWQSNDENIAVVSEDGMVSGVKIGKTEITLTSVEDASKKATCTVEVVKPTNVILYRSYRNQQITPTAYGGIGQLISNTLKGDWWEMVFESSVLSLGENAFLGASSLTEIILPDTVEKIGNSAFSGCSQLFNISLPDGLVSLGDNAFYSCTSLEHISLPNTLGEVGEAAFSCCGQLESFDSESASNDGRCLVVEGRLVAFAPSGLKEYSIPDDVESIAPSAMKYCTNLQKLTIPASVTEIGDYAFYNSSSLRSISFQGTTPPALGKDVFLDVDSLFKIYVPAEAVEAYKASTDWRPYVSRIVATE